MLGNVFVAGTNHQYLFQVEWLDDNDVLGSIMMFIYPSVRNVIMIQIPIFAKVSLFVMVPDLWFNIVCVIIYLSNILLCIPVKWLVEAEVLGF